MASWASWVVISFLVGVAVGAVLGWKAHSQRVRSLSRRRDQLRREASELQERIEQ